MNDPLLCILGLIGLAAIMYAGSRLINRGKKKEEKKSNVSQRVCEGIIFRRVKISSVLKDLFSGERYSWSAENTTDTTLRLKSIWMSLEGAESTIFIVPLLPKETQELGEFNAHGFYVLNEQGGQLGFLDARLMEE